MLMVTVRSTATGLNRFGTSLSDGSKVLRAFPLLKLVQSRIPADSLSAKAGFLSKTVSSTRINKSIGD